MVRRSYAEICFSLFHSCLYPALIIPRKSPDVKNIPSRQMIAYSLFKYKLDFQLPCAIDLYASNLRDTQSTSFFLSLETQNQTPLDFMQVDPVEMSR